MFRPARQQLDSPGNFGGLRIDRADAPAVAVDREHAFGLAVVENCVGVCADRNFPNHREGLEIEDGNGAGIGRADEAASQLRDDRNAVDIAAGDIADNGAGIQIDRDDFLCREKHRAGGLRCRLSDNPIRNCAESEWS
jgi:hypothetical protein